MVLETHIKSCMTELVFPEKKIIPKNLEKGPKMDPKQGFLNLMKNLVINFY